jgi:hypothetical protein
VTVKTCPLHKLTGTGRIPRRFTDHSGIGVPVADWNQLNQSTRGQYDANHGSVNHIDAPDSTIEAGLNERVAGE